MPCIYQITVDIYQITVTIFSKSRLVFTKSRLCPSFLHAGGSGVRYDGPAVKLLILVGLGGVSCMLLGPTGFNKYFSFAPDFARDIDLSPPEIIFLIVRRRYFCLVQIVYGLELNFVLFASYVRFPIFSLIWVTEWPPVNSC